MSGYQPRSLREEISLVAHTEKVRMLRLRLDLAVIRCGKASK